MPASVVVVYDDPVFLNEATVALHGAGLDVLGFDCPMRALNAIEKSERLKVLVTRMAFPPGRPNGVSLALVAWNKRRQDLKVLFVAPPELARHAAGVGEFLPQPVPIPELVKHVTALLDAV